MKAKAPKVGNGLLGATFSGLLAPIGMVAWATLKATARRPGTALKVLAGVAVFALAMRLGEAFAALSLFLLVFGAGLWAAIDHQGLTSGLRGTWRRSWGYKRSWDRRMRACKLEVDERVPVLRSVQQEPWGERVLVKLPWGLEHDDMRHKAGKLAVAFMQPLCRVREHEHRPNCTWLEFSDGRALRDSLPAPAFPDRTNLEALHLGRREDGKDWFVQARHPERGYQHLFVAGETGAGKSSMFWQGFRELAPAIERGEVELHVADPKFGQEFGKGRALFARYADTDETIAALLKDAVARMQENSVDMKAQGLDLHEPSRSMPAVLVVVDEVVSLLRDCENDKLAKQMERHLRLLLRMGRVFGVWVWAATQESKVENFPLRDLFPTSIGLRLARANQVDMVFGKGARDDGATCDLIPKEMPGAGYEITEYGIWMVRSFHVKPEDRRDLLERYGTKTREALDTAALVAEFEGVEDVGSNG